MLIRASFSNEILTCALGVGFSGIGIGLDSLWSLWGDTDSSGCNSRSSTLFWSLSISPSSYWFYTCRASCSRYSFSHVWSAVLNWTFNSSTWAFNAQFSELSMSLEASSLLVKRSLRSRISYSLSWRSLWWESKALRRSEFSCWSTSN